MDGEGTDGRALRGMHALLVRSPQVRITMEFAPMMLQGHGVGPAEMIGMPREPGFRFSNIGAEPARTPVEGETLARAGDDSVRNIPVSPQPV